MRTDHATTKGQNYNSVVFRFSLLPLNYLLEAIENAPKTQKINYFVVATSSRGNGIHRKENGIVVWLMNKKTVEIENKLINGCTI